MHRPSQAARKEARGGGEAGGESEGTRCGVGRPATPPPPTGDTVQQEEAAALRGLVGDSRGSPASPAGHSAAGRLAGRPVRRRALTPTAGARDDCGQLLAHHHPRSSAEILLLPSLLPLPLPPRRQSQCRAHGGGVLRRGAAPSWSPARHDEPPRGGQRGQGDRWQGRGGRRRLVGVCVGRGIRLPWWRQRQRRGRWRRRGRWWRGPPALNCVHCAATATPLWYTGAGEPRSLCNACGVRLHKGTLALRRVPPPGGGSRYTTVRGPDI